MSNTLENILAKILKKPEKINDNQVLSPITSSRSNFKYELARAVLPIVILTSASSCMLDRQGEAPEATNVDGGLGGSAGSGADAGGSAGAGGAAGQGGSAGEGGSAGAGGCFPTEEICDGQDNDCNNQTDENLVAPLCGKTLGVCETPAQYPDCDGANGWTECEYNSDYEEGTETTCDGKDNDCDGDTDEMSDLEGHQAACPEPDEGVCAGATAARTCESGQWTECDYGDDYSNGSESTFNHCTDQLDNDCDGQTDCDDSDCDNVCKSVTTLAVPPNVCHKQVRMNTAGASTWIATGSSNNDTLCTLNEISFVPDSGNVLLIWVDNHDQITVSTMTSLAQVSAGCSNYNYDAPNAPSLPNLINEEKIITLDTDVTSVNNGNEITYTHNKICTNPTNNHVFVLTYQ